MTLFDYLVLFIFITSIIISTMRGLFKEILSLAGWVVAFFVANAYGVKLAEFMPFAEQSIRLIVAFVSLFVGARLLMALLTTAVDSIIKASGLKLVDRSLGGLFGFARGSIITLALMLIAGLTTLPQQPFWEQALFRPTIETAALSIKPFLPGSFAQYVKF
ncbi:MAG: cvpA [Solimicrobium sp.]|jgi:membrane protein required for colicin V production|nr:cvpA [Solimicrobium sp.]